MNDKKNETNNTIETAEKAEKTKQELNDTQLDDVAGGRIYLTPNKILGTHGLDVPGQI